MGLINKYDFLEKLKASKYHYANDEYKSGYNDGIFHAEVTVDHVPTVYAVPVIRCKDCLYHIEIGTEIHCIHRDGIKSQIIANDYCSRAEAEE